jgi:hypothetical protein
MPAHLKGCHSMGIGRDGITIFPRHGLAEGQEKSVGGEEAR